eukprot:Nk52_evm37s2630 gene=Nk52_evmTU37s2630
MGKRDFIEYLLPGEANKLEVLVITESGQSNSPEGTSPYVDFTLEERELMYLATDEKVPAWLQKRNKKDRATNKKNESYNRLKGIPFPENLDLFMGCEHKTEKLTKSDSKCSLNQNCNSDSPPLSLVKASLKRRRVSKDKQLNILPTRKH